MANTELDTPIGSIYTTTALKAFTELSSMTVEQYLLGINSYSTGDGAKITLGDLILSMVLSEVGHVNLLTIDASGLLTVLPADVADGVISTDTDNTLSVGTDDLLAVLPADVADGIISADADNALDIGSDNLLYVPIADTAGADIDLSNLSTTGESKLNPDIVVLGNKSTNFSLTADRIHTANITGSCSIAFPTISTTTKYVNMMIEFSLASGQTLTLPTVKWDWGYIPTFSTTLKNLVSFRTTDNGTTWRASYKQGGA